MSGLEFYNAVLDIPQYKMLYENNIHFNQQMQYIKKIEKVTHGTLLSSIAYLSRQLLNTEIAMIRLNDDGGIR